MNAINLITKYSTQAWDKIYKAEAISSILDGDKDLMKFTGVKTVKIAKAAVSGLSNYHRPNGPADGTFGGDGHDTSMAAGTGYGYQQGDVSLVWEEFTIRCDRGVQLRVELFDDEETDGLAIAVATTEVSRTQVIPEVDAYVFSQLAELAGHKSTTAISLMSGANPAALGYNAAGPVAALNEAFLALAEAEVPEEDQVIFCSNKFYNMLRNTNELVRKLDQTEYGKDVKFTIGEYEGRKIIPVPASRFKTDIKLLNGGFGWGSNSVEIDFIVCAKNAVYHPVKYDKVRVFSPSVVQDFDGYKVNVRIYHDVFVPDNKKPAIYAHIGTTSTTGSVRSINSFAYDAENDILSAEILPVGNTVRCLYAVPSTSAALALGAAATGGTVVIEGMETGLSAGTYKIYGVDGGMIVTAAAANTLTIE